MPAVSSTLLASVKSVNIIRHCHCVGFAGHILRLTAKGAIISIMDAQQEKNADEGDAGVYFYGQKDEPSTRMC